MLARGGDGLAGPVGLKAGTRPTQEEEKILFKFLLNFGFGRTLENCIGRF
jgi:SMC interacting uncharacterized protein involved in chromosome segregation